MYPQESNLEQQRLTSPRLVSFSSLRVRITALAWCGHACQCLHALRLFIEIISRKRELLQDFYIFGFRFTPKKALLYVIEKIAINRALVA